MMSSVPITVSTGYLPSARQASDLSLRYAQSVYGIATLNETLPSYMTRAYALAPFRIQDSAWDTDEVWIAPTTLYSLDMDCEEARPGMRNISTDNNYWTDSNGCYTLGLNTNKTIGRADSGGYENGVYGIQEFSAMYVGYWNFGMASYYISGSCDPKFSNVFYAGFGRNKKVESDTPSPPTSVFCRPTYYQQQVNASISSRTKHPVGEVSPLGPKMRLSKDVFNITLFEGN